MTVNRTNAGDANGRNIEPVAKKLYSLPGRSSWISKPQTVQKSNPLVEAEKRAEAIRERQRQNEQALKNRLEDAKSYTKSYDQTFAKLMSTDVAEIPDAASRMKYQKQIDDITKKAFKMRSAQNLQAALNQSRMDIDKDLISYFGGQREILPVEAIVSQWFGKTIFEYDAD